MGERAQDVVNDPDNSRFVSTLYDGTLVLDVGHVREPCNTTLVTIGRNGNIVVKGASIAKVQCSFKIEPETNVVMFYDESHLQTSQVFGDFAWPFEYGRPRKVVVEENVNDIIGFGGAQNDLFRFRLFWLRSSDDTTQLIRNRQRDVCEDHPRLARTVIEEADTEAPSGPLTRFQTPGSMQLKLRYANPIRIGAGQFGEVFKARDVDSGRLIAVKKIDVGGRRDQVKFVEREIKTIAQINHVSVSGIRLSPITLLIVGSRTFSTISHTNPSANGE